MRSILGVIVSAFIDLLFPKQRLVRELESRDGIALRNFLPSAEHGRNSIRAIFSYRDRRVRTLIWEIKYRANARLIESAAEVLLMEIHSHITAGEKILLIPIPLSGKRLRERGFNQVEKLVAAVCKKDLSGSVENGSGLLIKQKHTVPQTELSRAERLQNLVGAFVLKEPEHARGRTCIVLDDVSTTGATIAEAKKVLHAAGARKVEGLVLAH